SEHQLPRSNGTSAFRAEAKARLLNCSRHGLLRCPTRGKLPMQRITRYPLADGELLTKLTRVAHPDRAVCRRLLERLRSVCQTVMKSVRETWRTLAAWSGASEHVICEGLSEKLVFNSQNQLPSASAA
uniref:DH domain-containing protein n=1 Tax=Macrostomum lignano TaxID=282301 RepID=A0A1I8FHA5_9PLAT